MEDLYCLIKRNIFKDNDNIDQHNFNKKVDDAIMHEIEYLQTCIDEQTNNIVVESILLADLHYLESIIYSNHYAIYCDS
jgi:hypothetical protein